jgi:hypothetical protein
MTLKEFLSKTNIEMIEICEPYGLIYNVYDAYSCYGLNIDTSNVPNGTKLECRTDFTLEGDTLSCAGISININDVTMLGM